MIYTFRHHRDKSNQKLTRHVFNRAGKFEFSKFKFRNTLALWKKEFHELIDQKNHHKIPLNPPLPAFGREKITKGGNPYLLPLVSDPERSLTRRAKGGREGFYKDFQTAKVLPNFLNFYLFWTFEIWSFEIVSNWSCWTLRPDFALRI